MWDAYGVELDWREGDAELLQTAVEHIHDPYCTDYLHANVKAMGEVIDGSGGLGPAADTSGA